MTTANENLHPSHAFAPPSADLLLSGAMAQPTQGDRITLARCAVTTALAAHRASDMAAVELFIAEALLHLRRT